MGFVFNPTAAAAAPPFNKGGRGFGLRLSRLLWLKVPLAKGGWPAGLGGFFEALTNLVSNTVMPPFMQKPLALKKPFRVFRVFRGSFYYINSGI